MFSDFSWVDSYPEVLALYFIENRFFSHTVLPDHSFSSLYFSQTLDPHPPQQIYFSSFTFRKVQASQRYQPSLQITIRLGTYPHIKVG